LSFNPIYQNQVNLLLDVLPIINEFECFALKGGTAINLFLSNMPRLSVDIDLTYLPIEPRNIFLKNITSQMQLMKQNLEDNNFQVQALFTKDKQLSKLIVYRDDANIKIEPNFVIRGSVFECEIHELCQQAQDQFLKYVSVKILSIADIYGGKICAALDRQHPRDLFDIKYLFDNQGLSDDIRKAFIVYLCSSNRPIHELLNPNPKIFDFQDDFNKQFSGMTKVQITAEELTQTRIKLINVILNDLSNDEKNFLISLKSGDPNWSLMPSGIEKLPSLQWKILNIKKMSKIKRNEMFQKLRLLLNN